MCKIYISNNPSSIRNHELGTRHKENVTKRLATMRKENAAKDKEHKETANALVQIEAVRLFFLIKHVILSVKVHRFICISLERLLENLNVLLMNII